MNHFTTKVFLFLLMFLYGVTFTVYGGTTGKISGTVTDVETGEGLPAVNITIEGTSLGGATDIDGNYYIINVPPGIFTLKATMIGFSAIKVQDVKVNVDKTTIIDMGLKPESIAGEEVVVIAKKPIIEKDLTASQISISAEEIQQDWGANLLELMSQKSGIHTEGRDGQFASVRGGTFTDVNYMVDGVSMNSGMIGDNYTGLNKSTVQEIRVLTGGFNAEYGQGHALVDVVTKEAGGELTGRLDYRYRPAGKYHWGEYLYSENLYDWTHYDLNYWTENDGGRPELSPEQRLAMWQDFIGNPDETMRDYDKRAEWEAEATLSGSITDKLGFMASARWKEGVNVYPQARKYNPEWNGQLKLSYKFSPSMKLIADGIYGGFINAGNSKSFFESSLLQAGVGSGNNQNTQITHPYATNKYWPYAYPFRGTGEWLDMNVESLKFSHVLSPSTFYDVKLSRYYENRKFDSFNKDVFLTQYPSEKEWYQYWNHFVLGVKPFDSLAGSPGSEQRSKSENYTLKFDLNSQVNNHNLIKTGMELTRYDIDFYMYKTFFNKGNRVNHLHRYDSNPLEGAVYFQDKLEFEGMVVNAGLRFDFYDPDTEGYKDLFDPYATQTSSSAHDPNDANKVFPGYDNLDYVDAPVRYAISPRLGVTHPITETTVLHFTYGHFNRRPGWHLIQNGPSLRFITGFVEDGDPGIDPNTLEPVAHVAQPFFPNNSRLANPFLDYEKMIEYEIGVDQEIAGLFRLDATMYYKELKNQTTAGLEIASEGDIINGYSQGGVTRIRNSTDKGKSYYMPVNSGHQDVRGIEVTLESRLSRIIKLSMGYDLSYNLVGEVGWANVYDERFDPNNRNSLKNTQTSERTWTPREKFRFNTNILTPQEFGPRLGSFYVFGNINVDFYCEYRPGQLYTAHYEEEGDFSTELNNRRWESLFRSNLRLTKSFSFMGVRPEIGIQVYNLFNNKFLNRPDGEELKNYLLTGELWNDEWSGTPDEWNWYSMSLTPPRQIYLTLALNF